MNYDHMTDDELVGPRTITECIEHEDGGWDVTLSCGHKATFVTQPVSMELLGCAQCINLYVERNAKTD